MKAPIILATDTSDLEIAKSWARLVAPHITGIKLGLEFFLNFGAAGVREVTSDLNLDHAKAASDEVLRYESSLIATYRTALCDADIAGTPIKAGQRVLCIVGSANRDAAVFAHPEQFGQFIDRALEQGWFDAVDFPVQFQ